MPAIAGIISQKKEAALDRILSVLSLRGGKFRHVWKDGPVYLGMLSDQENEQHTPVRVLFDGHLLNSSELCIEHNIKTSSPTVLIGALYHKLGEDFIGHLQGSFAIAIYDPRTEELLLFRDRIGEKPLYWSHPEGCFLFASELKGILASGQIAQKIDPEGLSFYLYFGSIPQEKSPISGVYKLQPGHFLRLHVDGKLTISPYWAYSAILKQKDGRDFSPMDSLETNPELTADEVLTDLPQKIWALDEPVANWNFTVEGIGSPKWLQTHLKPPVLGSEFTSRAKTILSKLFLPVIKTVHPSSVYPLLRSLHTHRWHIAFIEQYLLFTPKEMLKLHSEQLTPINLELFLHRFPALETLGPTWKSLLYLYVKNLMGSELLIQDRLVKNIDSPYLHSPLLEQVAAIPEEKLAQLFSAKKDPFPSWLASPQIQKAFEILPNGVLVESGIISEINDLNPAQMWALYVLEIWYRLYIERLPDEDILSIKNLNICLKNPKML